MRQKRPQIKKSKPKLIRRRFAPRVYLEERLNKFIFRVVTRGEGFKDGTVVKLNCIATLRLDDCTAVSDEDKTWEAQLIAMSHKL